MRTFKSIRILFLLIVFSPLLLVSCEEDTKTEFTFSRLFRPMSIIVDQNANNVVFTWAPVGDGVYSLEISRDSLLFTNDLQVFRIEKTNSFTISGLLSDTRYSVRIKAISVINPVVKDSEYNQITFMNN